MRNIVGVTQIKRCLRLSQHISICLRVSDLKLLSSIAFDLNEFAWDRTVGGRRVVIDG